MAGGNERPVKLAWILGALVLGVALGLATDHQGHLLGLPLVALGGFLGTAFLNLLKMLVVPLVVASIITGVAGLGNARDLGRLGLTALAYYVLTSLIAVVIALLLVNTIQPGIIDGTPARAALALHADTAAVGAQVQAQATRSLADILLDMIPVNIVGAAVNSNLIGLLLFGILFGWFTTQLPEAQRGTMTRFWEALFGVMMRMTGLVMRLAPIGVLGLTLKVTAEAGLDAARPLLLFASCVVLGILIYALVALPLLLWLVGRVRQPWRLFAAIAPALATAFSTASSAGALPVTLDCLQRRVGVSPRIAGVVLPLGISINHAGTGLYEAAAAMFIAQAYGLHLAIGTQVTVVLLALITSMGIAGIPAASLVAITVILSAVGLPAEAVGVLLVVDRVLDMARTAVNVLADAVCTVIVARLAGDTGIFAAMDSAATAPPLPESSSPP